MNIANIITPLVTVFGTLIANVLLIIFWLDSKVETNNLKVDNAVIQNTVRVDNMVSENSKRLEEVYKILITQSETLSNNTSNINQI